MEERIAETKERTAILEENAGVTKKSDVKKRRIKTIRPSFKKHKDEDYEVALDTEVNKFLSEFDGDDRFTIIDIKPIDDGVIIIYEYLELVETTPYTNNIVSEPRIRD